MTARQSAMTMKKRGSALGLVTAAALLAMTGCGSSAPKGYAPPAGAAAGLVRVDAPVLAAPAADTRSAADGSAELGLALLRQLGEKGNVAVSPASLEGVLALLLPGARGATADEIRALLGTRLTGDRYAAALGALRRAEVAQAAGDQNQLSFADDLWAQNGFRLRNPYLRTLAGAFGTGVHTVDFKNPDAAVAAINARVSQETRGMIPKLFDPSAVQSNTMLALTDALYLHADWARAFDSKETQQAPFHLGDGQTVSVPTMGGSWPASTGATPDWQTAELPYRGGRLAMDLLLPKDPANQLPTAAQLSAALASVGQGHAALRLPKFHFSYGQELTKPLEGLGLRTMFGPAADLSGIQADGSGGLQVSTVVQRIKVDVDEQGTTAAAASGVMVTLSAAYIPLSFDRPFVFLIRDTTTGHVLFLGRVTDPR
ncbi:serpin B [Streptacidiphilus sp. MAP12-20]|uniref:serpin family protein n=1 Tax=Streptacidiphilus sp. MAP12-20 TaxID=3156299 RepID=UPI00351724B7